MCWLVYLDHMIIDDTVEENNAIFYINIDLSVIRTAQNAIILEGAVNLF
jgi:hypothetical protein